MADIWGCKFYTMEVDQDLQTVLDLQLSLITRRNELK